MTIQKETTPVPVFPPLESMDTLTVRDLILARNGYHAALLNLNNVIGTAIGKYRLRIKDAIDAVELVDRKKTVPRTLENSEVTTDSWPAILVFVREWQYEDNIEPRQRIPQFLYLQDGRAVPTCVIRLDLDQTARSTIVDPSCISFPENRIGGGCGVYTRVQGSEHVGTVACLMTDHERTYALTARHVVGPPGQTVFTRIRGEEVAVGVSDAIQRRQLSFCELYPEYREEKAKTMIDAGFIRIQDMNWWTSQVLYIGELGDFADMHCANINLGLIGTPVRAVGAVSGDAMRGEICALFPRYRTVGGVDSLADIFISARQKREGKGEAGPFRVTGGDSGALWVLDSPGDPDVDRLATPVAVTWGVVDFVGGGESRQLAMATFLSNVCKATGMDIVTRMNIGYRPVWGANNHRFFAETTRAFLPDRQDALKTYLFGSEEQQASRIDLLRQLAVLPDKWCYSRGRGTKAEGPNHYADLDFTVNDKPLYQFPLDPKAWLDFYEKLDEQTGKKINRGMLPFRIGQVFRQMTDFLNDHELENAFGAAGVLIHYVADACNPAHVTKYTKGDPDWSSPLKAFHGYWDNEVMPGISPINAKYRGLENMPLFEDAAQVRVAALELMTHTLTTVSLEPMVAGRSPEEAMAECRKFAESPEGTAKISECVALAYRLLNSLWVSAWKTGGGDRIDMDKIARLDVSNIVQKMAGNPDLIPSRRLEDIN
jgi:hypothetical protein